MTVTIGNWQKDVMLQYINEAESTLHGLKDTLLGVLCISNYLQKTNAPAVVGGLDLLVACFDAQLEIEELERTLEFCKERQKWRLKVCKMAVLDPKFEDPITQTSVMTTIQGSSETDQVTEIKQAIQEILNALLSNAEYKE